MAQTRRKRVEHPTPDQKEEPRSAEIVAFNPPQPENEPPIFERIGDILRRERERRGDDLQQIADQLCIRRSFLEAIETSQYDQFPADIYVVGFLRSYAQYLELDCREVINYYHHEMEGRRKQPALVLPVPISEGRTPSAIVLATAALAAFLIYMVWYGFSTSDRATVTAPAVPPAEVIAKPAANVALPVPVTPTPAAPAPEAAVPQAVAPQPAAPAPELTVAAAVPPQTTAPATPTAATPAPETTAAPTAQVASSAPQSILPDATTTSAAAPAAVGPTHIAIRASQTSWVLIADKKGKALYDNVMKPGEVYDVPDTPGLLLTTGNGSGIAITVDGKDMPKIAGNAAHIIRNIPLNETALQNLKTQ